jgi:hypothetical protein
VASIPFSSLAHTGASENNERSGSLGASFQNRKPHSKSELEALIDASILTAK